MKVVDTHQHLWDKDRFTYSWLESVPQLDRSFRMTDYVEATTGIEVTRTVHIEADVDEPYMQGETQHVLALSEQPNSVIRGVVATARPESADFERYIEGIGGHPSLKGVRRVLHTQPDELGRSDRFISNVGRLSKHNLSFDICARADQLRVALELVNRNPDTTFILDHCGNPQIKEGLLEPWRTHMLELATFDNVYCKVSGIVVNADHQTWKTDDLRPYVEHVIYAFGWDRVMFGSDWPVCTLATSYRGWFDALNEIVASASDSERTKLFHDNAVAVYRL